MTKSHAQRFLKQNGASDDPNHNPPAFPFPTEQAQRGWNGTREGEPGMSLRDYFAAAATAFWASTGQHALPNAIA